MGLEKSTRHGQKTGATHLWFLGIVAMTDAHRHPQINGQVTPVTSRSYSSRGKEGARQAGDSPVSASWLESGHLVQHREPGQLLAVWADSGKGCLLSAAHNLKGLVTLLSFQHFTKKRIYLVSY